MPELLLVRHCESTGQAPEAPLSDEGLRQARALAGRLAEEPVDRIVSSPYRRALQTIEPFAQHAGLVLETDARLAERRLSAEPVPDWRDYVAASFTDPDRRAPGGESGAETLARGWAALEAVLVGPHRRPLIVSHGQLLALVLHSVRKDFGYEGWASLANPDVFRLWGPPGGPFRFERWLGS